MPDQDNPAAKPGPAATPDEFDFDLPVTESPRLKRRSLKPRTSAPLTPVKETPPAARALANEAPPRSAETARAEYQPDSREDDDAEINAGVKITEPAPAKPTPATTGYKPRTTPSPSPQPATPHGTLYYSSTSSKPPQDKEEAPPMKPTSTASPSPTTPSTPTRLASSTTRPSTVSDFRANVERQSREQKSVGNVLAIVVYVLIGFFLLSSGFAAYGIYALSKQLHEQSLTIDELDKRYAEKHDALAAQLNSTLDTLTKAQGQISRQQELITQQQETINKLITAADTTATAVRQERQTRAGETASLRARLNNLENRQAR